MFAQPFRWRIGWLGMLVAGGLGAIGCVQVGTDTTESPELLGTTRGPYLEFSPTQGIVPFPTDLLRDQLTGLVSIPEQCGETETATASRAVINQLDGFSTYKTSLRINVSEPALLSSVLDHVYLWPEGGDADDRIDLVAFLGTSQRWNLLCDDTEEVPVINLLPAVPLDPSLDYVVAVGAGIESEDEVAYGSDTLWQLINQDESPVVFDAEGRLVSNLTPFEDTDRTVLEGVALLWEAHAGARAQALSLLEIESEELLLAWPFRTQSIPDAFDLGDPDSAYAQVLDAEPRISGATSIVTEASADDEVTAYMTTAQCVSPYTPPCLDDILASSLSTLNFQTERDNPGGTESLPGIFDDVHQPQGEPTSLGVLSFVPAGAVPVDGYPVVVFGHGLSADRSTAFAIATQAAGAMGAVTVAIDWVLQGERAVLVDGAPQDIFSTDLGSTRDNFRQSALDALALVEALKDCTPARCGFRVDPERIYYMGQSLGALIGNLVVANSDDIRASVLNVGGAGWVDILESSDTDEFYCPIIDGLIDEGLLEGKKWNDGANDTDARCLAEPASTEDWRVEPGWLSLAGTARWILGPADGVNYISSLAGRDILIQEVRDDLVIPNVATQTLGRLLGIAEPVGAGTDAPTEPTAGVDDGTSGAKWVRYNDSGTHVYQHASLLVPVFSVPGQRGTRQMQWDALQFLEAQQ